MVVNSGVQVLIFSAGLGGVSSILLSRSVTNMSSGVRSFFCMLLGAMRQTLLWRLCEY